MLKKSLTKIIFVNFLVFLISILIIEIFFGHYFSDHSFGPYMREHRLKKNPVTFWYNGNEYNYIYKMSYRLLSVHDLRLSFPFNTFPLIPLCNADQNISRSMPDCDLQLALTFFWRRIFEIGLFQKIGHPIVIR